MAVKILHITTTLNPKTGGVCQALRTIINGLQEKQFINEVVSVDAPNESFLNQDNFKTIALGPSKTGWFFSKNLLPWLQKNIANYNIVFIHGIWAYHCYAVQKAIDAVKQKMEPIPEIFLMPHGMLDPYFQKAKGRK